MLNVTEDHLNRYVTMENYTASKELIFKNQTENDFCVLNYDNAITREMEGKQKSKIIWFSRQVRLDRGVSIDKGCIISVEEDGIHEICRPEQIKIPGAHNLVITSYSIHYTKLYELRDCHNLSERHKLHSARRSICTRRARCVARCSNR